MSHRSTSVRQPRGLVADIGANRNTVSRAYGKLARDGLLQIIHGKGALVARGVTDTPRQQPARQVVQALGGAPSRARSTDQDDVRCEGGTTSSGIGQTYGLPPVFSLSSAFACSSRPGVRIASSAVEAMARAACSIAL